jgi:hypothetical protein
MRASQAEIKAAMKRRATMTPAEIAKEDRAILRAHGVKPSSYAGPKQSWIAKVSADFTERRKGR